MVIHDFESRIALVMAYLVLLTAALLAATMGYAIQRGDTCTVATVDEVVTKGSSRRNLHIGFVENDAATVSIYRQQATN